MAIELATGLSLADLAALGSESASQRRAEIAVKFGREVDRLAKGPANKMTRACLDLFSKDKERLVRMMFAEAVKTSPYLPADIARRLARDQLDIALPILRHSPVLDAAFLSGVIETMPESHALAIADRQPLDQVLVDHLIAHKGTKRVVIRLIENARADLSEAVLLDFHAWGRCDPDVAERLGKRPNLPFAFVHQGVVDLADSVRWPSLGRRIMSKFEATQMQIRVEGAGHRHSGRGSRYQRLHAELRERYERGLLNPQALLAFLRNLDVDRLECGFAVVTGLEIRRVRSLLHGSDRRGLVALCLKAEFGIADYLAFRIALSLAELGNVRADEERRYRDHTMKFARDQFEKMRTDPRELERWLPPSTR
ncbi:MAG: DUF2336 domain-containing protein [Rhizobiales bacterium]|nr:DUF2336 domain-containing protein [Hyphomicrobiales bacterium]